uniref:Cupin type-2 domain-containing protein n=1 Tax=Corethron hystrix TaxID=216773 RepID=A0A7S1BIQ6_9STRA|mmetsp:Transcript_28186/g.64481  ORF Transcript_28186/g.64481 Transcript_28186/m.64481 type:complete len:205 (+) Transcript_28186:117-731(+)
MTLDFTAVPIHSSNDQSIVLNNVVSRRWGVLHKIKPTEHFTEAYRLFMKSDGTFPNNPNHPLLIFRGTSNFTGKEDEGRRALQKAGWTAPWKWIVFPYHHYHSSAWEILMCVRGSGLLQLGGEAGPEISVEVGDIILIPPGFVHKQLSSFGGFSILGSYPSVKGKNVKIDEIRGPATQTQLENILRCESPKNEPVTGILLSELY